MEPSAHQSTTYMLSRPVWDLIAGNREYGHVHVLSAFRGELGPHPRSQLDLLWHIAPSLGLTVQAQGAPQWPGKLGEAQVTTTISSPSEGDVINLVVERNCQKTPPSRIPDELRMELERKGPDGKKLGKAYRSRMVVVPALERREWAAERLAAVGLQSEDIRVGELRFARLGGRKRGIPYVEIRARARVIDATAFATALCEGTGKGRNYGLGLIRIQSTS